MDLTLSIPFLLLVILAIFGAYEIFHDRTGFKKPKGKVIIPGERKL